jgi:hypothetical protein
MKRLKQRRKHIYCAVSVVEECKLCLISPCERNIKKMGVQSTPCDKGHIISPFCKPSMIQQSSTHFYSSAHFFPFTSIS